jgi:hypothetical protein
MTLTPLFQFIKSVFSEEGEGSYSRCSAGCIVMGTLVWVSYVVWKNHSIPDLTGPATFLTSGTACTYGVNKASDIIGAIKGQK